MDSMSSSKQMGKSLELIKQVARSALVGNSSTLMMQHNPKLSDEKNRENGAVIVVGYISSYAQREKMTVTITRIGNRISLSNGAEVEVV